MINNQQEKPIIVSGVPRSGTTWMQHYLSLHPKIQIHGQPPKEFRWSVPYSWYKILCEEGAWAEAANETVDYLQPHYAGASEEECAQNFRTLYRDFMTGLAPRKEYWGLKYITFCSGPEEVQQFEKLWPETRWIIGVRNPYLSLNSLRNTFAPNTEAVKWFGQWLTCYELAKQSDNARICWFDIDRLAEMNIDARLEKLNEIWSCIGIEPTQDATDYAISWQRVHEVKEAKDRTKMITQAEMDLVFDAYPQLHAILQKENYDSTIAMID